MQSVKDIDYLHWCNCSPNRYVSLNTLSLTVKQVCHFFPFHNQELRKTMWESILSLWVKRTQKVIFTHSYTAAFKGWANVWDHLFAQVRWKFALDVIWQMSQCSNIQMEKRDVKTLSVWLCFFFFARCWEEASLEITFLKFGVLALVFAFLHFHIWFLSVGLTSCLINVHQIS